MKHSIISLAVMMTLGIPVHGGEKNPSDELMASFAPTSMPSRLSFGGGVSVLSGAEMTFGGLGAFTTLSGILGANGIDRSYDNGFVHVDSAGAGSETTWNWGYESEDQVVGDSIVMRQDTSAGGLDYDDEPLAPGIEFHGRLMLGSVRGREQWHWGLQGKLAYHYLESSQRTTLLGNVRRTEDSFPLEGIVPPSSPFSGSFAGPGPVIGTTNLRTISILEGGALVDAQLDAEAHLLTASFGPYLEVPIADRLALSLGAGLSGTWIHSSFSAQQRVQISGGTSLSSHGSDRESDFLFGWYAEVALRYQLTSAITFDAGLRWQSLNRFDHSDGDFSIDYDLSGVLGGSLGLTYRW